MVFQRLVQFDKDSSSAFEGMVGVTNGGGNVANMALDDQFSDCDTESDEEESSGDSMQAPPPHNKADWLRTLGRVQIMSYHERARTGQGKVTKDLVPVVAFCANRGVGLQNMNRIEYACLFKVEVRRPSEPRLEGKALRNSFDRFPCGFHFGPGLQYTQILQAKQRIPVVTVKKLHHPGNHPDRVDKKANSASTPKVDAYLMHYIGSCPVEPDQLAQILELVSRHFSQRVVGVAPQYSNGSYPCPDVRHQLG
jgi:hypothetical protein